MALAIDASSPAAVLASAVGVSTAVTASFSPPAQAVIFAYTAWDAPPPSTITVAITGNKGLSWNLLVRKNNNTGPSGNEGSTEIWWANSPTAQTGMTVTATQSGGSVAQYGMLQVVVFTGADPDQTTAASNSATANTGLPSASLTTTRGNSWVFGVATNMAANTVGTVGANQTLMGNGGSTPNADAFWLQRQTNTTPASGTSVTINDTAPTTFYSLAIGEVLPAIDPPKAALSGGYRNRDTTYNTITANSRWRSAQSNTTTVGSADQDTTIRRPEAYGYSYQLRSRDGTYNTISANLQWNRKRFSTNELGLTNYDPTVRPIYNPAANPYQLRTVPQWKRPGLVLADQSSIPTPDADPTIKRLYQNPYQLYDRTYWTRTKSVLIDQSDHLADPTLTRIPSAYANPYQLRTLQQWSRPRPTFWDWGNEDADPILVRQPRGYATPYQLYQTPTWQRIKLPVADQSEQTPIIIEIPPDTTPPSPPGGANLGRRGAYYPDRTPEQVLREEEEIMVML